MQPVLGPNALRWFWQSPGGLLFDVTTNPAAGGATFAGDTIGGKEYTRFKLIHGAPTVNDGDVSKTNPLPTRESGATPVVTSVAANAASVTVLAANANRIRAWLYNDDAAKSVYIKFGAAATVGSFTKKMLPLEFLPIEGYAGIIDAIWEAGPTGNMRVTEVTP